MSFWLLVVLAVLLIASPAPQAPLPQPDNFSVRFIDPPALRSGASLSRVRIVPPRMYPVQRMKPHG